MAFDFFTSNLKPLDENKDHQFKQKPALTSTSKSHTGTVNQSRTAILGMEKALNSLLRGSKLAESDTVITIDKNIHTKLKTYLCTLLMLNQKKTQNMLVQKCTREQYRIQTKIWNC